MVSKLIKSVRCEDVLNAFMSDNKGCVFFTLTTPDVVDIYEIRRRWRRVRHFLVEKYPGVKYVMNYEIHPKGHGWHIHSVWNCFIPLRSVFAKLHECGFGRVDIRRVNTKGVSDYLTKHALKAYRGVSRKEMESNPSFRLRLVNASRGLPVLSDYAWRSPLKEEVRNAYNLERLNQKVARQQISFNSLYQRLEVAALLRVAGLGGLSSYVRDLRRQMKMLKGVQKYFDFSIVNDS